MVAENLEATWLLLLGCTYTIALAAIVIALLFRHQIVTLAALYSIISTVVISCHYFQTLPAFAFQTSIPVSNLLDASLLITFTATIACFLHPFYQAKRLYFWPALTLLAILTFVTATVSSGFYLAALTLVLVCAAYSLHSLGHIPQGMSAILLSASKLLTGFTIAWLHTDSQSTDSQSTAFLPLENSFGISVLYLLDMAILTSICWKTYNLNAIGRAHQRIAAARQEMKVASLAPLIKASRHELRAPLADIIGLAELIDDGPLDQAQRKSLIDIKRSAKLGLEEINRLFNFTANNDSYTSAESLFSLSPLITDCAQYYSSFLEKQHKELVIRLDDVDDYSFSGQQPRIRQILIHLLEYVLVNLNAKEALIQARTDNDRLLEITIESSGHQPVTPVNQLPKNIAQELIDELGGTLEVNPENTDINITLPVGIKRNKKTSSEIASYLTGKRVLVLDDNITSCNVIVAYLERFKINASHCTSSVDATAKLYHAQKTGEAFDLAIVDYIMPDIDGISYIQSLVSDEKLTRKPEFIIMSNTNKLENSEVMQALGLDIILEKPVLPDTLKLALVNELYPGDLLAPNRKLSALIIEDNPVSATLSSSMLNENFISNTIVSSGFEALQELENHNYDLILVDLNLEDTDGVSLCGQIRKMPRTGPDTARSKPFIAALTADDSTRASQQCIDAGMDAYVTKPLTQVKIRDLIDRLDSVNQ